jgi:probable rRNA maturation factor
MLTILEMSNSKKSLPVFFHYIEKSFSFTARTRCKKSVSDLFKKERVQLEELHYIFCSDSYLLDINKRFLKHDDYTDIITFPLSEAGKPVSGEIYISIDRIKENARKYNASFSNELLRVIFHGALHLCGYKDKSLNQIEEMRQKEEKYLDLFRK